MLMTFECLNYILSVSLAKVCMTCSRVSMLGIFSVLSLLNTLISSAMKFSFFSLFLTNVHFLVWICSSIIAILMVVRCGLHRGGSLQDGLGVMWTCGMTLASAYMLHCLSVMWLQLQMIERSLRWEWVLIWCVAIEYWRSSSIRIIFVDYQTSKLQCNY